MTTPFNADELAGAYISMRDERDKIKAEMDARIKEVEDQMDLVESALLEMAKDSGANSINTPSGTIIRNIKTRVWTNDWESMYKFILDNGVPDLLEKRIAQKNMENYLTEHPDKLPEGLNIDRSYTITVRRPKTTA